MERLWQWAWDRHGPRFSWAAFIITALLFAFIYGFAASLFVGYERSSAYPVGISIGIVGGILVGFAHIRPGSANWLAIERFAAGGSTDAMAALTSTYALTRELIARTFVNSVVLGAATGGAVALTVGASPVRAAEHAVLAGAALAAVNASGVHFYLEAMIRPARLAAALDSGPLGDHLPRSAPAFSTWATAFALGVVGSFTVAGLMLAVVIDEATGSPLVLLAVALGVVVFVGIPITVGSALGPSLRPLRDLTDGTARVIAGDYSRRVPVVQDDDLGTLTASFNRMQDGLAQRERLQAAFGSYVDPALASRLLDQGDDIFTGDRVDVTVMFVDIRDFTSFAEANTAEDTVAHLNALFEIVVPAVLSAGGHVNKYLGDGAMAVFGAPNTMTDHAEAGVAAARVIERMVDERFQGATKIGIGINTGSVIAGTIGGGGKLEFTLIGDTVNVAARIEALTKTTGDTILLTQDTLDALTTLPDALTDRGTHALKGKATGTRVYALEPARRSTI